MDRTSEEKDTGSEQTKGRNENPGLLTDTKNEGNQRRQKGGKEKKEGNGKKNI